MSMTFSPPLVTGEQEISERHWTVEEFYRAADAGEFADPGRLELIHGRIQEKMPEGGRHTGLRRRIARRLRAALEPHRFVCEECPLRIAFDGEPIPDILFTRKEDYGDRHPVPADVVLLLEVSDSSLEYDLGGKVLLYAQASIDDYWVVAAEAQALVVHRQPSPNGYAEVTRLSDADTLSPLARPEAVWTVSDLLGRGEAQQQRTLGE